MKMTACNVPIDKSNKHFGKVKVNVMKKLFSLLTCFLLAAMCVVTTSAADFASANNIITDGLVGLWDGTQNTATGHDANAAAWTDLSGNGNDIALTLAENLSWKDDALYVGLQGNGFYPDAITKTVTGQAFTFQIYLDRYDYAEGRSNGWTAWLIFEKSTGMPITFYYHYGMQCIFCQTENTEGNKFDLSVPVAFENLAGKVLTLTYAVGGQMNIYTNEELVGSKDGVAAPIKTPEGQRLAITGVASKNNSADAAEYNGIAIYNRALNENEVAANVKALKEAKVVPAETTAAPAITTAAPVTTPATSDTAPITTPATSDATLPVAVVAILMAAAAALAAKKRTI